MVNPYETVKVMKDRHTLIEVGPMTWHADKKALGCSVGYEANSSRVQGFVRSNIFASTKIPMHALRTCESTRMGIDCMRSGRQLGVSGIHMSTCMKREQVYLFPSSTS